MVIWMLSLQVSRLLHMRTGTHRPENNKIFVKEENTMRTAEKILFPIDSSSKGSTVVAQYRNVINSTGKSSHRNRLLGS
jgi:hypothetical protein